MISALSWMVVFCRSASGTSANLPVDVVNAWPTCAFCKPAMSGSVSCMPLPASNWIQ